MNVTSISFIRESSPIYSLSMCYNCLMSRVEEKPSVEKAKTPIINVIGAKFFGIIYGHPIRDMKMIVVAGDSGKVTTAHFIHKILSEANQRVAILASEEGVTLRTLHSFLSKAWKNGANYVIVTADVNTLKNNLFYDLPAYATVITNFNPTSSTNAEDYQSAFNTIFCMNPEIAIINKDDLSFDTFANFKGEDTTLTYGCDSFAQIKIERSALYKKGTEARLNLRGVHATVASFVSGEPTISNMAAAAATAVALHISEGAITAGIADYDPDGIIK